MNTNPASGGKAVPCGCELSTIEPSSGYVLRTWKCGEVMPYLPDWDVCGKDDKPSMCIGCSTTLARRYLELVEELGEFGKNGLGLGNQDRRLEFYEILKKHNLLPCTSFWSSPNDPR